MLSIILLLATISSGSFFMAAWKGRRYEEILPISGAALVLLLFLTGIFGLLEQGVVVALLISTGMYIATIAVLIKKKNIKNFLENILTPGAVIYGGVLGLTLFAIIGKQMDNWDEFSHWGDVVKGMWLYNDFATNPELNSTFRSYPPGMSLFQYFFEKISSWTNYEGFSEWRLYFAYQTFAFSFLMPFTRKMRWRSPFVILGGFITIFLTPSLFYSDFYTSIYIDPFLGFLFGAGLLMILFREECDRYYTAFLCAICSMLVLAKAAGMLFAGMLALAFAIDCLFSIISKHEKREWMKIRHIVEVILSIVVPNLLWKYNVKINEASEFFTNPYDIKAIMLAAIGKNETYQQEVWDNFWHTIYKERISLGNTSIALSYYALPLFFLLLYVTITMLKRRQDGKKSVNEVIAPITATVTVAVYVVGVVASYMCIFVEREALELASFQRYISIAFLGAWIYVVISLVVLASRSQQHRNYCMLIILVGILIITPMDSVNSYVKREKTQKSIETRKSYEKMCNNIIKYTTEDSKIYFISQEDNGFDYWVTRFAIRPWKLEANWGWSIGDGPFYDGDYLTKIYDAEKWMSELVFRQYDYVALYKLNDFFYDAYAELFDDSDSIGEGKVYKVDLERRCLVLCK